ncbi:hypothetical protein [Micromonospora sp.]|uniref:hypothetical protein n=1 Tax=Micromonospora sp. TaxID=1876 RepID=UPI003B3A90F2
MYGFTITHTDIDQRYNNAPDALDALFDYLRGQLVGAANPRSIDWVFHDPAGPRLDGTCGSGGPRDTLVEANLAALHHGIASDLASELYEASRLPAP